MSVHRWTGPSRRLCAGRTVLMPSLTGPRQRACEACGTTGVEQRLRTANASTDGAGRRTGLVLSVSWAALVTTSGPRQPFCGACGNTASNSLRPADDPRPATTGAKSRAPTVNWPGPAAHTNPKPWPALGSPMLSRAPGRAFDECSPFFVTLHFHSQAAKAGIAIAASARTLKLWLLQRGAFVLHLSVEHESRSLAFTPWQHKQKR